MRQRIQYILLALGGISLLAALWAGLLRAGWGIPLLRPHHPLTHGPLFISGFLGTVIGLEKARALDRWWGYLGPLFSGGGAVLLFLHADPAWAATAFVLASFCLSVVMAMLLRRAVDPAGVVMLFGAVAWLCGNLIWMTGQSIPRVVGWWVAFPVLVIVGERLELSRVLPTSKRAIAGLLSVIALYGLALGLLFWRIDWSFRIQGIAMLLMAVWLFRHDLARRTVHTGGVHKYTAVCLLSGFGWLALGGLLLALWGIQLGGLRYDAVLHVVFLGFVFAMIFGHAPIIAPMLLGRRMAVDTSFYVPWLLLQVSLLMRLASDLANWLPGRSWGALLNVAAVVMFMLTAARGVIRDSSTRHE